MVRSGLINPKTQPKVGDSMISHERLMAHRAWLMDSYNGERLVCADADLQGVQFNGVDLRHVDFRGANLKDANFHGADLRQTDFQRCNLDGVGFQHAYLHGANLADTDLRSAELTHCVLSQADLRGATLPNAVPAVPGLNRILRAKLTTGEWTLTMHGEDTTPTSRCRAGWGIHMAGEAGAALSETVGFAAVAALIFAASCPELAVPNFYAHKDDVLADLRACALLDGGV